MNTPNFKIGIHVSNDALQGEERVCELYFLDAIYNKQNVNWFTGEVTEDSMLADVINQVNEAKPTRIISYIDSWGGSCDVGLGIYNYLRQHSAKVETKILNSCASIATVISAAGNKGKIGMPANGFMVIHKAQTSASGTSDELREAADVCDAYTNNILDIYERTNRKGKLKADLYACIKNGDYWMTGDQALEMGFVDYVYNDDKVTVSNSIAQAKTIYNNIPQHILDMAKPTTTAEVPKESILTNIANLFNSFKMKVDEIVAKLKTDMPNNGIVGTGEHAVDVAAMLEAPITNMLNTVKESITNQITEAANAAVSGVQDAVSKTTDTFNETLSGITTKLTETIASVATLTETVTAQAAAIAEQNKTITNLTADVERQAGRPAAAAGKEGGEATGRGNDNKKATFVGRTQAVNVAD